VRHSAASRGPRAACLGFGPVAVLYQAVYRPKPPSLATPRHWTCQNNRRHQHWQPDCPTRAHVAPWHAYPQPQPDSAWWPG